MFSKILIKVFYLTGPEFANNTVPELFVDLVIVASKGLAKLANIACQTLLFVSVSLAMDNQRTLLLGREQ